MTRKSLMKSGAVFMMLLAGFTNVAHSDGLPAVPVPVENPITEPKRVLGKILFWDEQLSSDDTVACGTCHRPASGGADPRAGVHPGQLPGSIDDVRGSPGIVRLDKDGQPVEDAVFGLERQVTPRLSPSNFGALWAEELFWDGRARSAFADPLSGVVAIASGGALENQAIAALSNEAEMAKTGRTWNELSEKIRQSRPLALATNLPPDIELALREEVGYPRLFEEAFGDTEITPVQIAFALATYQRTLVADQAPWDRFQAGDVAALTQNEKSGWRDFQALHCDACHVPPLFTNNEFFNIGLRRAEFDYGRHEVTGIAEDAGEVKVPSLRNVSLRRRLMHTGEFGTIAEVIRFYVDSITMEERDDIPGFGVYTFNFTTNAEYNLRDFLGGALTDLRVENEEFPFDRPTLHSEATVENSSGR